VGETAVWDLARAERVGAIPQAGVPAYNPWRDEIYVVGHSAEVYAADTLAHRGSLTPDIAAQTCRGCLGQPTATDVSMHPELGLLAIHLAVAADAHGPGALPTPRLFALETLAPVSATVTMLARWEGPPELRAPPMGRADRTTLFARAGQAGHLRLSDSQGVPLAWRDGLTLDTLSPVGDVAFTAFNGTWLALDARTWQPLGYTPRLAPRRYDPQLGLYLALDGARLRLVAPSGGEATAGAPTQPATLPSDVTQLVASPAYGDDATLLAVAAGALYRSRDGARQSAGARAWERLGGGLPSVRPAPAGRLVAAFSPGWAEDGTLYAGGWDERGQGLGVWRSTDRGDTWAPLWQGLDHLRVDEIAFSPGQAADGGLWAQCRYRDIAGERQGRSLFRWSPCALAWERIAEVDEGIEPEVILEERLAAEGGPPAWPIRAAQGGRVVEARLGDGWRATLALPPGQRVVGRAAAPSPAGDPRYYVLSAEALYRTTDGGLTWEQVGGPGWVAQVGGARLTALAVWADGSGREVLVLADHKGQVHQFQGQTVRWVPVG
ncbi:MAG: hypothetical protein V1772_12045, partial [Chloroflexota bacterium]